MASPLQAVPRQRQSGWRPPAQPTSPVTAGTIAVCADEAARFTQFAASISALEVPPLSKMIWRIGNDISGNRNAAVEQLEGDWLWFIDDDHAFAPDLLLRLLRHDVSIVAPLCLRRQRSFSPVACRNDTVMKMEGLPANFLIPVEATGSSGMLIRKHVLETLQAPLFKLEDGKSEDIYFCEQAREAGFTIHVDLGARLGHITTAVVWPSHDKQDGWTIGLTVADGLQVKLAPLP